MIRRLLLAGSIGALLAVATTSAQSAVLPQVTDAVGDGNGINGQGVTDAVPEQTTPYYPTSVDIDNITWSTDKPAKKARVMTVKLLLAGPVCAGGPTGSGCRYQVSSSLGGCAFTLLYVTNQITADVVSRAEFCAGGAATSRPVKHAVGEGSITWSVPLKEFADAGLAAGTALTGLGGRTVLSEVDGTPGLVVDLAKSDATYRVGS